jgi:uncharacterized protein (TIGR02246 family)
MSDDERAIRDLIWTWMAASQAGNLDRVLSLMSDDVIFLVPGQAPFGKEAFAAASRGMQGLRMEGKSDVQEVVVSGDWAWCRTHLVVTVTPPGGETMRRSGYTLSILRKEPSGHWLLVRDANLLAKDDAREMMPS